MTSEKFCLKWNDFQQNIASSYQELQQHPDFSDVTLVCEETEQIEAHRIILSACSPFFNTILKRNKHSHPMIYMKGLKARDMVAILDFIYKGEVNIYQEDLDGFLALAEELHLKGLAGSQKRTEEELPNHPTSKINKQIIPKQEYMFNEAAIKENHEENPEEHASFNIENSSIVSIDEGRTSIEKEDIKAQIDSMMERVTDQDYKYKCSVCGKTGIDKTVISRHVETHIDGLSYPCNQCGKISRSSNGLQAHISRKHRK